MADHSLALSALRVAVYAPRDGEMAALAGELARARGDLRDLSERFAWAEARYDTLIALLQGDIDLLNQQLRHSIATSRSPFWTLVTFDDDRRPRFLTWQEHAEERQAYYEERENDLRAAADRLARWAAQGRSEEDMPFEIWRALQVMRGEEPAEEESEMRAESAAAAGP